MLRGGYIGEGGDVGGEEGGEVGEGAGEVEFVGLGGLEFFKGEGEQGDGDEEAAEETPRGS